MSLQQLSLPAFLLGLAGLAGLLYALQRLRVRHARVEVVTTIFWRKVLEDTHARELVERFRHPWVYLLLLAIAGGLWAVVGGLEHDPANQPRRILLLDRSASAAVGDTWQLSCQALLEEAERGDPLDTAVYASGAGLALIHAPGEGWPLLEARLDGLVPELAAPHLDRAVGLLTRSLGERSLELVLVGRAGVADSLVASLPETVQVSRRDVTPGVDAQGGLLAVGVSPSEVWGEVDLLVRRRGEEVPAVTLDGALWEHPFESSEEGLHLRGLPARGALLRVELPGAAAPFDHALLRLPSRRPVRVQAGPGTPPSVVAALRVHPGISLVEQDPEVWSGAPTEVPEGVPALLWTADDGGAPAILVEGPGLGPEPSLEDLEGVLGDLGLDRVVGPSLATQLGRTLEASLVPGPTPRVHLWASLVDPERGAMGASRALPVVTARVLAWLEGEGPWIHEARAGGLATGEDDPLREESHLWPLASDEAAVSAFAPSTQGHALLSDPEEAGGASWSASTWVLLFVLLLLLFEERLLRLDRIP